MKINQFALKTIHKIELFISGRLNLLTDDSKIGGYYVFNYPINLVFDSMQFRIEKYEKQTDRLRFFPAADGENFVFEILAHKR